MSGIPYRMNYLNRRIIMTGEEIFYQALVLTYITGILIMLYIGWRDK
tara:strand:- start:93 stop:233 length:141 start_codon:yes stop_codon:yes gene_type:complete